MPRSHSGAARFRCRVPFPPDEKIRRVVPLQRPEDLIASGTVKVISTIGMLPSQTAWDASRASRRDAADHRHKCRF